MMGVVLGTCFTIKSTKDVKFDPGDGNGGDPGDGLDNDGNGGDAGDPGAHPPFFPITSHEVSVNGLRGQIRSVALCTSIQ